MTEPQIGHEGGASSHDVADKIGFDKNAIKAKYMIGGYRDDLLRAMADWLESIKIKPEDTATSFQTFVVGAIRRSALRPITPPNSEAGPS